MIDPDMPADQLRLHMGELSSVEISVARAAIRLANSHAARSAERCDQTPMTGVGDMPDVVKYLLGGGSLEGYHYPDFPDNNERYKHRYWWRNHLRKAWSNRFHPIAQPVHDINVEAAIQLAFEAGRWMGQVDLEESMDQQQYFKVMPEAIASRKTSIPGDIASTGRTVRYNLRSDQWREGVKKECKKYLEKTRNLATQGYLNPVPQKKKKNAQDHFFDRNRKADPNQQEMGMIERSRSKSERLNTGAVDDRNIPLQRLKKAIQFYAAEEHWMPLTDSGNNTSFIAVGENGPNGYDTAKSVLDDLWAIGQMFGMMESVRDECLAIIDNNVTIPREVLAQVKEALELNQADQKTFTAIEACSKALTALAPYIGVGDE